VRARRAAPSSEPIADPEAAREAALRLLERARRTRTDLARRLKDKGFAANAIDEALARLERVGLIDDTEYARAYLAGRWGRRPAGWRQLEQQLRGRGVSEDAVRAARAQVEARDGAADEVTLARRLLERSARRYEKLEPRVRQQRLYALLARRGFDGETIRRALALPKSETGH